MTNESSAVSRLRKIVQTGTDLHLFHTTLNEWRKEQESLININKTGPERQAALCVLSDYERKFVFSYQKWKTQDRLIKQKKWLQDTLEQVGIL